jgi:DNA polymerase III alpha subunit
MTDLINAKLREIKTRYQFLHVINNGFCYLHRDDHEIFCIGQAIKQGINIRDIDQECYHNRHLLSPEERETLAYEYGFDADTIEQARTTSLLIGSKDNISLDFGKAQFPVYKSPSHIKDLYQQYLQTL